MRQELQDKLIALHRKSPIVYQTISLHEYGGHSWDDALAVGLITAVESVESLQEALKYQLLHAPAAPIILTAPYRPPPLSWWNRFRIWMHR